MNRTANSIRLLPFGAVVLVLALPLPAAFAAAPFNGGTGADSLFSCQGLAMQPVPNGCVLNTDAQTTFNFTSINVPAGYTLFIRGNQRVVTLFAQGDVNVAGLIDGSGGLAAQPVGVGAGGNGAAGDGLGNGGAGGSFAGLGGVGGADPVEPGSPSPAQARNVYGTMDTPLGGSSGGSNGATRVSTTVAQGGAGGYGLDISSGGVISISGVITVDGGSGQSGLCGRAGGGGGSGGYIRLAADSVQVSGALTARGGAGGDATSGGCTSGDAGGGGGGGGRIRILYGTSVTADPAALASGVGMSSGGLSRLGTTPGGAGGNGVFLVSQVPGNPAPVITDLSPSLTLAGSPSLTMSVRGTGFVTSSVVRWNGSDVTTSFVSDTQLDASVSAADVHTAGTASVTVFTPTPGGGTSNPLLFSILPGGGGGTGGDPNPPPPGTTPELDSLLLFGSGLGSVLGYLRVRRRARG